MSLRKRINRENTTVSAESQEDDVPSDRDDVSTSATAREMRRREREHKSNNKEMTEEEMMAMALRLSEQEANITAQKLQEEEEAVKKALQDSMFGESQNLTDAAPACVSSRRKLVYSNGESQTDTQRSTTDSREGRGQRAAAHMSRTRKRRRVEGSPLMEMPDLSQTQPSASSSEPAVLGSPQSCDSTQIEDCVLPRSPVFPSSSTQVQIRLSRLDQDMLDSCATSGFVLCSQESGVSNQSSHCQQPSRSPTFPRSPETPGSKAEATNSQMLNLGSDTQPELSQEPHTSPVFGRTDCKSALQADTVEAIALTFSSQESSTSFCLDKDVSLSKSPVFSKTQGELDRVEESERQSPVFGTNGRTVTTCEDELEEREDVEEEQSLSQTEPTIDMTLHWSEEDDDNATPVVSPSPVFPEERRVLPAVNDNEESAPSQTQGRAAAPESGSAVSEAPCFSGDSAPQTTVHYYWGVPFCPRGLDPDEYTKVIVAQMEVYANCLKQAQRGLLNKAKWGEPILPQPEKCPSPESKSPQIILPTRRSRRLRGQLELESEEEVDEVTDNIQGSQRSLWEEEEAHKEGDKEINQDTEKEAGEEEEEGQQKEEAVLEDLREDKTQGESDCEVCPETPLSDDSTQELTLPSQPLVGSPEIEMVQVDSSDVPEPQTPQTPEPGEPMVQGPESPKGPMESTELLLLKPGDRDLRGPHCETQSRESPQQSQSPDMDQNLNQNLDSEELCGPARVPGPDLVSITESPVQCPLCQRVFPSDQIEMHAAFCDGEPAAGDKASPKLRRKRTRRGETEDASHTASELSVTQAQEKCYICRKAVPLRDYHLHTDQCLQRPALRTATTGGLLSALDQSDSVAGPSGSTGPPQEVINLVDDDEEEEDSLIQISNSPIRSFTSISDAQDCLIDFSRQHQGKRPGARPGAKHRSKRR